MDTVGEIEDEMVEQQRSTAEVCVQPGSYFLELSLDWIVLRASENIHHLLRESHVTLIDEPLGKFVHAQALHDLRNLFSRLSGTTGIGRAYAVRLTDDHDLVDIAFQQSDGRVLLEAVPSVGCFGESFGSVGGLVHSQRVLLALTQAGLSREDAYTKVQRNAMKVWESDGALSLLELLEADPEVSQRIPADELHALFDLDYHLKHVDTIFARVFGPA